MEEDLAGSGESEPSEPKRLRSIVNESDEARRLRGIISRASAALKDADLRLMGVDTNLLGNADRESFDLAILEMRIARLVLTGREHGAAG